ncbi:MAG: hypothetical protein U1E60_03820 [Reyranellaceae bacterium]
MLQGGLKFLRDVYMYEIVKASHACCAASSSSTRSPTPASTGARGRRSSRPSSGEGRGLRGREHIAARSAVGHRRQHRRLYADQYRTVDRDGRAIVFLVPSVVVVGLAQPVLNRLSRSKITIVRALSDAVLSDGRHVPAGNPYALIGRIYDLRLHFARLKIATKSFNQLITGLGLLGILVVGGWLAIQGRTEIGIIVAFMSGYERMTGPVRDLLSFYRRQSMMRVQYRLVADAFTQVTCSASGSPMRRPGRSPRRTGNRQRRNCRRVLELSDLE